jgi:iron(III) transport system ATP-binding protein
MPALAVRNLTKTFGDVVAVNHIDFDIEDGEILTLLGPSGCGKTTTLRLVAGLEQPDSGEITMGDRVVTSTETRTSVPPQNRAIGMVFQSYAVWPHMTVFENVAYPLRAQSFPKTSIREKVQTVLAMVGLVGLDDRSASLLSGGQQQRVAVARALVFEPKLLLMDEPLSNLDAKLREQMRLEFRNLQQRIGITCIYVTHDQAEAMVLSDRIAVMNSGNIEQLAGPRDIFERPKTATVADFIGQMNYIACTVVKVDTGTCRLKVDGADRDTIECPSTEGLAPQEPIVVRIRPHSVEVRRSPSRDGRPCLECRVSIAAYLGDRIEYELSIGNQTIAAAGEASLEMKRGDKAFAVLDPAAIVLVPK